MSGMSSCSGMASFSNEEELEDDLSPEPSVTVVAPPSAPDLAPAPPGSDRLPSRWKAPFKPYAWQLDAADAWVANGGRGIMQVVTGAGKTALGIYLYARLLDRLAAGQEMQLIVVVPRIELAKQWAREIKSILACQALRLGVYHGGARCRPESQDILIITQDSARRVLPRMLFDRPVMLIADECHRLGAPAASRILELSYTWTLGLSATPERWGDTGFERILVPRLGSVVWRYGYVEAVRDGIITPFRLFRVGVRFSPDEQATYDSNSEKITKLLDALKRGYPRLYRTPESRFWQTMGDLKQSNPQDERFDMLTAAANERRSIVHHAAAKYEVVRQLAMALPPSRKVLCFHERIDGAARLRSLLGDCGRRAALYHSQMPEPARAENLTGFKSGRTDWLVACKSLDEGLDIPAVDTIVIVAGTRTPRQLIQRLGRALRRKGGERTAIIFLVEVSGVDEGFLEQDGLAELREAAKEVREVDLAGLGDLIGELGFHHETAGPLHTVDSPEIDVRRRKGLPSSKLAASRSDRGPEGAGAGERRKRFDGLRSTVSRFIRRVVPSWTGGEDMKSYYDKDSSPE